MENIAQALFANLFASSTAAPAAGLMSPPGAAGGLFAQGELKSANNEEFLQVLSSVSHKAILSRQEGRLHIGPELRDNPDGLAVLPEDIAGDNNYIELPESGVETLFAAAITSGDSARPDVSIREGGEDDTPAPILADGRGKTVRQFLRSETIGLADIPEEQSSQRAGEPLTDEIAAPETSLDNDELDLPRRFASHRERFLAGAPVAANSLAANSFSAAARTSFAVAEAPVIDAPPMLDEDSLPLIQTLSAANERASSPMAITSASETAAKAGAQIVAAISSRGMDTTIEVRLDPPELGRVMIDFEGRGVDIIRATVSAEAPETLDLMRRNIDLLQRELEKSGLHNIDLQFREGNPQSNANNKEEHFFARGRFPDDIAQQMSETSLRTIALGLDGRLDRLL